MGGPGRRRLPRNLGAYWQMEAANVLFVPAAALYLAFPRTWVQSVVIAVAIAAVAGFLVVGALYWRGLDRRLRQKTGAALGTALSIADRVERPLLWLTIAAAAGALILLVKEGWSPTLLAALVLTLLAGLEYINYYHYQLQHFDNPRDLKRLITFRGLKRAHMARDLAAWRGRRSAGERIPH